MGLCRSFEFTILEKAYGQKGGCLPGSPLYKRPPKQLSAYKFTLK